MALKFIVGQSDAQTQFWIYAAHMLNEIASIQYGSEAVEIKGISIAFVISFSCLTVALLIEV